MGNNILQNKLYDIETSPPPGMWNRISEKLDAEEASQKEATVIPMPVARQTNWTKIALAASVIGFIAMTALWFANRNNGSSTETSDPVVKTVTTIKTDTVYITKPDNNNNTIAGTTNTNTVPSTTTTSQNNQQSYTTSPVTTTVLPQNNTIVKQQPDTKLPKDKKTNTDLEIQKVEKPLIVSNNNKDIIIKDENGKPVRNIEVVKSTEGATTAGPDSKGDKAIGNIINKISMASDKEEIDSIINSSTYWKKQVQEWRNKLIKSGYKPNLINSLDILKLKKLLEEKNP
jgi:hypothetical protein